MKKWKKTGALFCFLMFALLLPSQLAHANDASLITQTSQGKKLSYYEDDTREYYYVLKNNKAYILQYMGTVNKNYRVPQTMDGHPVVGLGAYGISFLQAAKGQITSITIPAGVTEISDYAFSSLDTLCQVKLPSTLKRIGSYAFSGCANLRGVTLPDSLKELGTKAFYGCKSLKKVVIGKGLRTLKGNTFMGCGRLVQVIIPKNVKRISKTAFKGCTQMKIYINDDKKVPAVNTVLMAPVIGLAKAETDMVKLTWKREKGATGYEIWRSTSASGRYRKIKALSGKSTSYTDKKLSKSKRYYYKARSVKKGNGRKVYSPFTQPVVRESLKVNLDDPSKYGGAFTEQMKTELEDVLIYLSSMCSGDEFKAVEKLSFLQLILQYTVGYSMSDSHFYDAWGALVNRKASCYGYSYGTLAFCDQVGIPCRIVRPNSEAANPNHMWNMVKVGKTWYILDTQLNAGSGGWYAFLVSSKTYRGTGMRWDEKEYPKCPKDY